MVDLNEGIDLGVFLKIKSEKKLFNIKNILKNNKLIPWGIYVDRPAYINPLLHSGLSKLQSKYNIPNKTLPTVRLRIPLIISKRPPKSISSEPGNRK